MSIYQVDAEDANFLFLENADSPTHISLLYIYDPSGLGEEVIRFNQVRQHVQNRLASAPVFRQKVQCTPGNLDYPYWVEDDAFDLDFHLRHLALPKPGDWRQLCIQVSRLHSRSLDMSRPLWELYVIEGLDHVGRFPPGCFALYFKVHHCAMDEFTAQELMESLHSYLPDRRQYEAPAPVIARLRARRPSLSEMLQRAVVNNSVRSIRLAVQSMRNFGVLSRTLAQLSLGALTRAVDRNAAEEREARRFARKLGTARVFEGGGYDRAILDRYSRMVPGARLSHALLAVCGEALGRYLQLHDELGQDSLGAYLQVNVRNAGAHALVGNHLAVNRVDLGTNAEFPIDRLQAVYSANKELHSVENAELTSFRLRSLYENLPAPALAWLGWGANRTASFNRRLMQAADCGVAEMFGPEKPLYFLGARLRGFTGVPPLYSGCGLMFTVTTYCDRVWITFTSDRSMMPDPHLMRRSLDETMIDLEGYLASGRLRAVPVRQPAEPVKRRRSRRANPA